MLHATVVWMAPVGLYVMFDSLGGEFEKARLARVHEIHLQGPEGDFVDTRRDTSE